MKKYYTRKEANEIVRINAKRLYDPHLNHPPLSTERLPYDKFPDLRSRETLKKYLYEISSNEIKAQLSSLGRTKLKDKDVVWP